MVTFLFSVHVTEAKQYAGLGRAEPGLSQGGGSTSQVIWKKKLCRSVVLENEVDINCECLIQCVNLNRWVSARGEICWKARIWCAHRSRYLGRGWQNFRRWDALKVIVKDRLGWRVQPRPGRLHGLTTRWLERGVRRCEPGYREFPHGDGHGWRKTPQRRVCCCVTRKNILGLGVGKITINRPINR